MSQVRCRSFKVHLDTAFEVSIWIDTNRNIHIRVCAFALTAPALWSPALPGCLLPPPPATRSPCQSPGWKELSQGPVLLCRPLCGSAQGCCRDLQHVRPCTAPLPPTAPASVPFVSWPLCLRSRPLHCAEGHDLASLWLSPTGRVECCRRANTAPSAECRVLASHGGASAHSLWLCRGSSMVAAGCVTSGNLPHFSGPPGLAVKWGQWQGRRES